MGTTLGFGLDVVEQLRVSKTPDRVAIAAQAEREFFAARDAWRAERGEVPPAHEAPDPVRETERKFLAAREAWFRDQAGKTGGV